jgi:hypothetical protein
MATKTVKVKQRSGNQSVNLQVIANTENGVPLFEPHEKPADRVKPPVGTALEVVSHTVTGSGAGSPQYYYITDNPTNGTYRRYFIKLDDVS